MLNNNGKIVKKTASEEGQNHVRYIMGGKIKTVPMKINA
jgi:hypothetical protein